jgi:hypothetical protein
VVKEHGVLRFHHWEGRVGWDDIRISCLIPFITTIMGLVFLLSVYTLYMLSKYQANSLDE